MKLCSPFLPLITVAVTLLPAHSSAQITAQLPNVIHVRMNSFVGTLYWQDDHYHGVWEKDNSHKNTVTHELTVEKFTMDSVVFRFRDPDGTIGSYTGRVNKSGDGVVEGVAESVTPDRNPHLGTWAGSWEHEYPAITPDMPQLPPLPASKFVLSDAHGVWDGKTTVPNGRSYLERFKLAQAPDGKIAGLEMIDGFNGAWRDMIQLSGSLSTTLILNEREILVQKSPGAWCMSQKMKFVPTGTNAVVGQPLDSLGCARNIVLTRNITETEHWDFCASPNAKQAMLELLESAEKDPASVLRGTLYDFFLGIHGDVKARSMLQAGTADGVLKPNTFTCATSIVNLTLFKKSEMASDDDDDNHRGLALLATAATSLSPSLALFAAQKTGPTTYLLTLDPRQTAKVYSAPVSYKP